MKFSLRALHESILREGTCSKCGRPGVLTSKMDGKEVCYYGCLDSKESRSNELENSLSNTSNVSDRISVQDLWTSLAELVMDSWQDNGDGPYVPDVVKKFVKKHNFDKSMWHEMDEKDSSSEVAEDLIKSQQEHSAMIGSLQQYIEQAFELLGDHVGIDWDTYNLKMGIR